MQDFVILFHQMPPGCDRNDHWDLMLRNEDQLLTWAIDSNPLTVNHACGERLPDHRLKYLEFVGEISDGRGWVEQIAKGKYRWLGNESSEQWTVELEFPEGKKLLVELREAVSFRFHWL